MRTVIVGCGRVGSNLARWLSEEGDEVAVVDSSEAAFNRLGEEFAGEMVFGSAVDEDILRRAGTDRAQAFVAVTNADTTNIMAAQLAQHADFFSFGTNDLTQATYAFSRDDAEAKFMALYLDKKILSESPFEVLDVQGVGRLIEFAAHDGREANPKLEVGICGEHGGEPRSIRFFHETGLDYVSCSAYRIPVARLAAAQAKLETAATVSTTA